MNTTRENWNVNNTHDIALSSGPKEQKIAMYNEWAPTYDKEMTSVHNPCWKIAGSRMFHLIKTTHKGDHVPVVVDAGCGTGGPAKFLRTLIDQEKMSIRLIGYDYSEGMLQQALEKNIFDELNVGDFFGDLPVKDESANYVFCIGIFAAGHCRIEAISKVLGHLRKGGYGLITIRAQSYEKKKTEFLNLIHQAGCVVCETAIDEYLGPVMAVYMTVRKD